MQCLVCGVLQQMWNFFLLCVSLTVRGSAGKGVEQPTEWTAMEGASAQVNCTYQTPGFNGLFCNLSFIDICHSSVTVPKMLEGLLLERKTISFDHCIAQLFFLHLFACAEIFLLTVMAYDRYVAICAPLHYPSVMDMRVCVQLVFALWLGGTVHSLVQTFLTIRLPYCGPNIIDSYFCDVPPVIKLACTDTYLTGMLIVSNSGTISLFCFLALVTSYTVILKTVS
ncbi:hypothetical protein AB1E18_008139 [Capra hircus]